MIISVICHYNGFKFSNTLLSIWTDLEPILGVLAACLPVIPPVFRRMHKSNLASGNLQNSGVKPNSLWVGTSAASRRRNDRLSFLYLDDYNFSYTNESTTLEQTPDLESRPEVYDPEQHHTPTNG